MKKLFLLIIAAGLWACTGKAPKKEKEVLQVNKEAVMVTPGDTMSQDSLSEEMPPPKPDGDRHDGEMPPPKPDGDHHDGEMPPPPPPDGDHHDGEMPPPPPPDDDNMRGFDPASEDDMPDNGMRRYMENDDERGWD